MNKRQQNQISNLNNLNEYLEQFGAKVKDGEKYINSSTKLTILNKFNIEKNIEPYVIKRLKSNSEFWNLGCGMNKVQQEMYDKINNFLAKFGGKIKEGENYTTSEEYIKIVNKYGVEKEIIANNIKRMTNKNDFWSFDGKSDDRQKNQLEIARKIAKERGGELISEEYINSVSKLKFRDGLGNFFMMSFNSLSFGDWSPYEAKRVRDPEYHLDELRKIAQERGGKLLSTEWRGWNNKYLFKNDKEEEFLISPHNLKNRGWPKDITKYNNGVIFRKKTDNDLFEELQLLAEQNGGKLIDTEWKGSHFDYSFKHSNGKIFQINSPNLKRRGWPHNLDEFLKFSNGHKKSVEDRFNVIKKLAEDNNGKILETEWLGNHHKYTCFFENGQQFIMEGVNLKRNGWPKNPESYFKRLNSSIIGKQNQKDLNQERLNTIKKIAEDNNGKILETEWLGNHHKYTCFFENGQQFIMEGVNLKRNGWPKNQTQYMNYINSIK